MPPLMESDTPISTIDEIWTEITSKCTELKSTSKGILGCRFLYSPCITFTTNNGLLIAGMNPGKEADMDDRAYPKKQRNAYLWETWAGNGDYQKRVCNFAQRLAGELSIRDWHAFFNNTLTSNFLPFRSASDAELGSARRPAKAFARHMWSKLLVQLQIRTIVAFGGPAERGFNGVINELPSHQRPKLLGLQHSRCGFVTDSEVSQAKALITR